MAARLLVGAGSALLLAGCMKGDEELQRQLIELRAAVEAKTKSVEQLESQVAILQREKQPAVVPQPATAPGSSTATTELATAKARIAELEQSLAAATAAASAGPAQIGRIDMDQLAGRLEEDLTRKARQLRELVQRQSPSSRIDEIALKSIEYPQELITPFNSAITFNMTEGTGSPIRLMFPVTADLSGSWTLPAPDEIQKAYKAAKEQPRGLAAGRSTQSAAPRQTPSPSQSQPMASSGGGPRMSQRADGVFVMDWGDGSAGRAQAQQQQQQQQSYTAPAPVPTPTPSTTTVLPQAPPVAQPRPSAAPQAPSAPPPVMPIVGDRVIRFDD